MQPLLDALAVRNNIPQTSLELSEPAFVKTLRFVNLRDGLEHLVKIGKDLSVVTGSQRSTHG